MQMKYEAMNPASRWRGWFGSWLLAAGTCVFLAISSAQAQGLPDFTDLVEKVGPAVVNIRTLERSRVGVRGGAGPEVDEDMLEFFRRFGPRPTSQRRAARVRRPMASRSSAASAQGSS